MTSVRQSRVRQTASDSPRPPRKIPGEEGIWVFVLGDMTVFALFFATFMYSRGKNRALFARDHADLHVALGTINTVLLLSSSLLVVLAVQRVLSGRREGAARLIAGALGCGAGFVGVKAIEWTQLFAAHKGVGSGEFYSYYFMFTGIHLLHVLIGMAFLSRLIIVIRKAEFGEKQARLCETGGIFWHMVDLLWVVLFALFYLVR
ncbi:cytochrome c oxidase subunit III [Mycobacterium lentiflavum]|uniref:Probable cytochrome c oxidase subunit 3 n=1 Tax=Mycobacterium lentiflavum TaxID=141349 RepID=A0A0E3WD44_MYCLN|nr:cytochrome c oxidase subunit 3 [Mycobacterium lentiflavum]CQD17900.1 cytochrome c oxidase subunit III [Mycobacterium lentiflavum]